jgi:uncharacterized protein
VEAIHAGEVGSLTVLLREHPGLAAVRIVDDKGGSATPLHAAADWPGFFPHGPEVVVTLIEAGADPNAPVEGSLLTHPSDSHRSQTRRPRRAKYASSARRG